MKISLDFDDTFTRDPELWLKFIRQALTNQHDIRIVTFRSDNGNNDDIVQAIGTLIPVIYTGGIPKRRSCYEQGFFPHVWIDDMPEIIVDPESVNY